MADKSQRTEKPTPKHRKEMREKGSVARSTELSGWGGLLVVVVAAAMAGRAGRQPHQWADAGHVPSHVAS